MKKITLLLLLCMATAQSQNFEWLQTPEINFSLSPDGVSYPLTTDNEGNVYMAGFKENPVPYNDVMGFVFYNKYDKDGNLLYSKMLPGEVTVYEMATDSAGNLLMAAGYRHSIVFPNVAFLSASDDVQYLMIKFDPEGNLIWQQPIEIQDSFVNDFRTITTDAQDNIYIGYDDYNYSYISKLNPAGTVLLTITQEYARMVTSISVDNQGNIYGAGSCAESIATYAGVAAGSPFFYNTYAVKYNASGTFQWIKYVDDITCPLPQIKARTPDAVYFSSYLFGSYAFGPITTEGPASGGFGDFFLAKLNADGDYQWVREADGTGTVTTGKKNFLELDQDGNVYFAGGVQGTIDWGNGITTSNGMNDDAVLVKYDADGNALMAVSAGGSGFDRTDSVRIAADGSIYLSGMANGDAVFGGFSHEGTAFQYYPYLVRVSSAPLGVPEIGGVKISLYPNPAAEEIHFNNQSAMSGTIWNILGQKITDFSVEAGQAFNISALAKGTYLVKTGGSVLKFVKS
ncbi:T9SS type A sorting domain-containing protein [Flavobacterium magnum]|nr:T9SS type A sorting domain-containing protein [Flavobacterium magnum]